jgi:hypothetical protein
MINMKEIEIENSRNVNTATNVSNIINLVSLGRISN